MRARGLLAAAFVAVLLAPSGQAYPESSASVVRVNEGGPDDVERVWHEPVVVEPGTQWQGYIKFRENHSIAGVKVQLCDVGRVCFAPPIPIKALPDGRTWTFNTTDYRDTLSGEPIRYEAGWRLGMQFILSERLSNGTVEDRPFPSGVEDPDNLEFHYLAFDMPEAKARRAPAPGFVALALIILLAVAVRRH
ncbi:MAG: hypothetical protein WC876_03585 [Candidatus Thermoplasmatota archaeon]|jgi:hypothetical protein